MTPLSSVSLLYTLLASRLLCSVLLSEWLSWIPVTLILLPDNFDVYELVMLAIQTCQRVIKKSYVEVAESYGKLVSHLLCRIYQLYPTYACIGKTAPHPHPYLHLRLHVCHVSTGFGAIGPTFIMGLRTFHLG